MTIEIGAAAKVRMDACLQSLTLASKAQVAAIAWDNWVDKSILREEERLSLSCFPPASCPVSLQGSHRYFANHAMPQTHIIRGCAVRLL